MDMKEGAGMFLGRLVLMSVQERRLHERDE